MQEDRFSVETSGKTNANMRASEESVTHDVCHPSCFDDVPLHNEELPSWTFDIWTRETDYQGSPP